MKKLSILIFFIALVGIMPSLLQYGAFVMAKDFATQQVPFIVETKRLLASGAPFWSWNTFTGADAIGSYSFYTLTSPFVWFACLFPYKFILQGITIALILKFLCAGWASFTYFRKMGISEQASILGGLMYAFSSFAISNLGYYHFMEPMICFPLLLLGVEKFIRDDRRGGLWLAGTVFLTAFVNYYFLPGSLICAGLYGACRLLSGEFKTSVKVWLEAAGLVILGVLMAAVVIVPSVMMMEGNPRVAASFDLWFSSSLERLRTLFAPQLMEKINPLLQGSGWNSNSAHLPVVGVLLAVLYGIRHRDWLAWLCLITVVLYLTPLNGIFSLFTNPTYTRWAYALVLFLVLASVKYLDEGNKVSRGWVVVYVLAALGITVFQYAYSNISPLLSGSFRVSGIDAADNILVALSLIIGLSILVFWSRSQTVKRLTSCVVVAAALFFSLRVWTETDSYFRLVGENYEGGFSKLGYIDKYLVHNHFPRNKSNVFEYRTDFVTRDRNIYLNLGMMKNRPSVESYNSAAIHRTAPLFSLVDTVGSHVFSFPNKDTRAFDALMSVKEVVVFKDDLAVPRQETSHLVKSAETEEFTVYDNPDYIPMGISYDTFVRESEIDSAIQLLADLSVNDEDIPLLKGYATEGTVSSGCCLDSLVSLRRSTACERFSGTTTGFKAKVQADSKRLVFFSVPFYKGFKAFVDGVPTRIFKVNFGQMAVKVDEGSHDIVFRYLPAGLKAGLAMAFPAWLVFFLLLFWKREK